MSRALVLMERSPSLTTSPSTLARESSPELGRRPRCLRASQPWQVSEELPMQSEIFAASRSSSIPRKEIGDLVGNNTPVVFLRDPLKFPDLNHAIKRDPRTGMRSADNNWDFWTNLPEALHQVTVVMRDRGIPRSFRHMHGFGSHTYSFVNAKNERFWVKFTFKTLQGIEYFTD